MRAVDAGDLARGVRIARQAVATDPLEDAGAKVEWKNVGNIAHTVTADADKVTDPSLVELPEGVKPFDSGLVGGDESYSRTFDAPGTYRYVCIPHEGTRMIGTVVVE